MRQWERLRRAAILVAVSAAPVFVAGCDLLFPQRDIIDAARLYAEHRKTFAMIRNHYYGPFHEARRIPAFDAADDKPEDIAFLERLQQSIPVEILQLYTWGKGGPDMIEVIVGTYGIAVSGSVVSLVYSENFVREEFVQEGVEVFDKCDARALAWLDTARVRGFADVFCRIDDHWYAYQSVT